MNRPGKDSNHDSLQPPIPPIPPIPPPPAPPPPASPAPLPLPLIMCVLLLVICMVTFIPWFGSSGTAFNNVVERSINTFDVENDPFAGNAPSLGNVWSKMPNQTSPCRYSFYEDLHMTRFSRACVDSHEKNMKKGGYDLILPFVQEFDILVTECYMVWGSNRNSNSNTCAWKFEDDVVLAHRVPMDHKNKGKEEKLPIRIHVSTHGAPRHHNYFVDKMLPFYEQRYELTGEGIIVHSGGGDPSVGSVHAQRIVNSKAVFRWIVENQRFSELIDHPKIVQLPIGICARELHTGLMHDFLRNMSRIMREQSGVTAASGINSEYELSSPSTCNHRYRNVALTGSVAVYVAEEQAKSNNRKRERLLLDSDQDKDDDDFHVSYRRRLAVGDGSSTGGNVSTIETFVPTTTPHHPHPIKNKGDRHINNTTIHNSNSTVVVPRKARPWLSGRRIDNIPHNIINNNHTLHAHSNNHHKNNTSNSNTTAAAHKSRSPSRVRAKPLLDFAGQPLPPEVAPASMNMEEATSGKHPLPLPPSSSHKIEKQVSSSRGADENNNLTWWGWLWNLFFPQQSPQKPQQPSLSPSPSPSGLSTKHGRRLAMVNGHNASARGADRPVTRTISPMTKHKSDRQFNSTLRNTHSHSKNNNSSNNGNNTHKSRPSSRVRGKTSPLPLNTTGKSSFSEEVIVPMDVSLGIVQYLPQLTMPTTPTQSETHRVSSSREADENSNLTFWGWLWNLFFPQSQQSSSGLSTKHGRRLAMMDGNTLNNNNNNNNSTAASVGHKTRHGRGKPPSTDFAGQLLDKDQEGQGQGLGQGAGVHPMNSLQKEKEERKKERDLKQWMSNQPLRRSDYRHHHRRRRLSDTATTATIGKTVVAAGNVSSNGSSPLVISKVDSGSDTNASDSIALNRSTYKTWSQRIDRVLFCFHDRSGDRSRWMSWAAHNCTICDYCNDSLSPRQLWFHYTQYRYVFSPYGNGYDCFRSFEILLLGAIPVFHYFPGALAYEQAGLKAVYVTMETDVNHTSLAAWNRQHPTGQGPLSLLTREHWARRAFQNVTIPFYNTTGTTFSTNNSTASPTLNATNSSVANQSGVPLFDVTIMDEQSWNHFWD